MAQVIIRNLDDAVVAALKARAAAHGISLEEELRRLLAKAARPTPTQVRDVAAAIRALAPRATSSDLEELIREDRDR